MAGRRFTATATTTTSSRQPPWPVAGCGRAEGWDAVTAAV
jgi:hypothetical protein